MSPLTSIGSTEAVGRHKTTSDLILLRIAEAAGTRILPLAQSHRHARFLEDKR
jgi:hypothetical protein